MTLGMRVKIIGLIIVLVSIGVYYLAQNDVFSEEILKESLHDKVVVICGASSGIGEETAYKYAKAGTKLILSARSLDKLEVVKEEALKRGARSVDIVAQDFSKLEELEKYRERVLAIHPTIDVLMLNHAAIIFTPWTALPSHKKSPEFTLRTYNINILSYIELTRVFMEDLEASSGQIHVTSSLAGIVPLFNMGLYASTKHALNGFFFSLQQELIAKQSRVSVSVFSLGLIMTKELNAIFSDAKIPNYMKGDINDVADIIVSAAVSRPRDVDYPIVAAKLSRGMFYFLPNFHELRLSSSSGRNYEEYVEKQSRVIEASKKMNYQMGNV